MKISSAVLIVLTLGLTLGLGPASTPAHAESFLNYILPSIFGEPDTGPKPEDTLRAPFGGPATKDTAPSQNALMNMYDETPGNKNTDMVSVAHRSPDQVGEWITGIVTQVMTIDPVTLQTEKFAGFFTPYALQEYNTYLATSQTLETLKAGNLRQVAFAEGKATLVQEGLLEGAYRWVFRVPVMLTSYDKAAVTLKGKESPPTQQIVINVQITRVSLKQAAEGMLIERWSVVNAQ